MKMRKEYALRDTADDNEYWFRFDNAGDLIVEQGNHAICVPKRDVVAFVGRLGDFIVEEHKEYTA